MNQNIAFPLQSQRFKMVYETQKFKMASQALKVAYEFLVSPGKNEFILENRGG